MRNIFSRLLTLTLLVTLAAVTGVAAQDEEAPKGWITSLVLDITTTQTAYSDSWDGGEAGSFNWVSNLNGTAERQLTPSIDFKSTLKLSFGQTLTQKIDEETGEKNWEKPQKSTDLIDWENVARLTKDWIVDPYVAFRVESQFLNAKIPGDKKYFAPILLTESAGIARKLYKNEKSEIISRLGLAIRQTIQYPLDSMVVGTVPDTATQYSWLPRETFTDGGLESVTDVKFVFNERLQWTSKMTLYKAFFFSKKDKVKATPAENYWKAIDVNWENIVTANITKIISVNFYTQVLYDKQVSRKGRIKETLGIGFVFKMM